ncbi:MAG: tetratricopeptide repeat protein [Bacteroidia bacterium]
MSSSDKKAKKKQTASSVQSTGGLSGTFKGHPYTLWGVLAIVFIAFLPALSNGFVNWDDPKYVLDNNIIKDLSAKGIKAMFTSFYGGNYHPLTALSNAIEFKLFGLNPKPFHFFNLVLHLANTFLVYRLIRFLASDISIALTVALLFGIHPMHVESVAWISERKDVLYTFFYLLATLKYVEYRNAEQKSIKLYANVLALFLCSLLSKSAAVVFPVTLVLIDLYFDKKIIFASIINKIPLFVLSAIFGLVALRSQGDDGALSDLTTVFSYTDRVFLICYSLLFYVAKLFLPFQLSAFYAYPVKAVGEMLPTLYYITPLIILVLVVITFKIKQFTKELAFGFLFYLANIILVIQLVPIGQAMVSERYSYMPYIGLFFIIAHVFYYLRDKYDYLKYLGIGFLIICGAGTFGRTQVWKDGITLWNDVIKKDPKIAFAYYNLGNAYKNTSDFKSAINAYSGAIKTDEKYVMAYFNRAHAYADIFRHQEAIADYSKVISLKDKSQEAIYNRAVSYAALKQYDAAIADYTVSLELKPQDAAAYYSRANMKAFKGAFEEAIPDYTKAIEIDSKMSDAYNNRGNCKLNLRRIPEACEDWKISLSMGNKNSADMINNYCK